MSITIKLAKPFMNETTWDLDGYLTNLRGADLKEAATELGISFKSKTPVGEIREAIRDHYVAVNTDFTESPTDVMFGSLTDDTQTSAYAVVDDLSGVQERILSEVVSQPAQSPSPVTTRTSRPDTRNRAETLAWIEEEVAAGRMPFPYGLRGRGVGAKTYNQVSDRTLNRQIKAHTRAAQNHPLSSPAKLPNSERVQKYARQNSVVLGEFGILPDSHVIPKLTTAQYRRVRKTRNKIGGDLYVMPNGTDPSDYLSGLFSRVARTPDGTATIFHQFSR